MVQDWNFWLSVITAVVAVIALFQTSHQTKLSNKQLLFERRLKIYKIVQDFIRLYKDNKNLLHIEREDALFANSYVFVLLTNDTFMEQQAYAIKHPLEAPYHQNFLRKREELRGIAEKIPLIFMGEEAQIYGKFVACYEQLLFRMYQYQIALENMRKANEDHLMTVKQAANIAGEPAMRELLTTAIKEINDTYETISKRHTEDRIKRQISLV